MLLTRPLGVLLLLTLAIGSQSVAILKKGGRTKSPSTSPSPISSPILSPNTTRSPSYTPSTRFNPTCLIGAFNVKAFGKSKMSKPEVVAVLVDIVQRYDVLLIQEIRDSSGEAIQELLRLVNEPGQSNGAYSLTISERLGRTSYKEQYAFFYKSSVTLLDTYQYDDGVDDGNDWFEREPYAALFSLPNCDVKEVAMVASHIKPTDAVAELNHMDDAMLDVESRWGTEHLLLMGDLNADCSYVSGDDWKSMDLNQVDYAWLIPDTADTTVSSTNCAYDRFVVSRTSTALASRAAFVYRFDQDLNLSYDEAYAVSDHYPVDLHL